MCNRFFETDVTKQFALALALYIKNIKKIVRQPPSLAWEQNWKVASRTTFLVGLTYS